MTHNRTATLIMTLAATLAVTALSPAATIHNVIPGVTQPIPNVATYATHGDMMAGMEVTAFFSASAPETVVWVPTGNPSEGAAMGGAGDWRVSVNGDTYNDDWKLEYNQFGKGLLTGLRFDGMPAGVVPDSTLFDRTTDSGGDIMGTPGSVQGRDFITNPNPFLAPFDIQATYEDQIKVNSDALGPRGDLFRFLDIRFFAQVPVAGFEVGMDGIDLTRMIFKQDTDSASLVPEPSSLILLGVGSIGVAFGWQRKRNRPNLRVSRVSRRDV